MHTIYKKKQTKSNYVHKTLFGLAKFRKKKKKHQTTDKRKKKTLTHNKEQTNLNSVKYKTKYEKHKQNAQKLRRN